MRLFKSKLRRNIEYHIEMFEDSITALRREISNKQLRQTLNPAEYAKYVVLIKDTEDYIELLKSLL